MPEWLLLPPGWPRALALVVAAGILIMIWLRRAWLEELVEEGSDRAAAERSAPAAGGEPQRSLLIVARNEEEALPGLLQDLDRLLARDPALEIMLADDQSTDGTRPLLEAFCADAERHGRVRLLPAEPGRRGKPAWLRHGVDQCRGRQVLFSDADCRLPAGWSLALGALLDEGLIAVGGLVLLEGGATPDPAARWQRLHWLLLSGMGALLSARMHQAAPSLWGANLAFDRAAVDKLGGYARLAAVDSGEDLAFARALARLGAPHRLAAFPLDSRVRTRPETWAGSARQLARWLAGLPRLAPLHLSLVLGAAAWLGALAAILLLRPILGLVLGGAAVLSLSALLDELAARLREERPAASETALYLAAWPLVALLALWHGLRGTTGWRRPA
ncbi:MAG: glycosyltransferase [bacterium]|nr:glycosyltransferase [bacterium]